MSTISLPQHTLEQLDRISRDFVWGSTPEKRRQHLIAWDRVCLPKCEGGLGIRKATQMNKALLSKLGWRLLNEKESLWARILRNKYSIGDTHNISWLKPKGTWSSTWRSVGMGLREVTLPGLSWVLGNGSHIRFWIDKWLTDKPLCELVTAHLPNGYEALRVKDLWVDGLGWDLSRIEPYVSVNMRLQLAS